MKTLMTKTGNIFKTNVWLLVVAIILLFFMGIAGWKLSLHLARKSQNTNSINAAVVRDAETEGETNVYFE